MMMKWKMTILHDRSVMLSRSLSPSLHLYKNFLDLARVGGIPSCVTNLAFQGRFFLLSLILHSITGELFFLLSQGVPTLDTWASFV